MELLQKGTAKKNNNNNKNEIELVINYKHSIGIRVESEHKIKKGRCLS